MSDVAASTEPTPMTPAVAPLVRHTRREGWGRALLLWRRNEKRAYQFEDGEMRVFAERFASFLQPARRPDPVLRHQLREKAVADGHVEHMVNGKKVKKAVAQPTLDDQMTVFEGTYEGAFFGDAWTEAVRVRHGKKRLKRHRDPAIEDAQKRLGLDTLRMHIEAGNPHKVIEEIVGVVASTDMATKKQLEPFRALKVDATLAHAAVDFLHDVRNTARCPLDNLRVELAKHDLRKVPWTTLTAARALLHPKKHIFVRPSVFRAQAKLMAPQLKLSSVPTPEVYARCLELALGVQAELERAGFQPRDLLDVVGFMRVTLTRTVHDELVAAMVLRRAEASEGEAPALETTKPAGEVLH